MSGNFVHAGHRKTITAATAHLAGDLIWQDGFYGVVQDNVAAGDKCTLILDGIWVLPRVASTVAAGTLMAAPATEQATGLPILAHGAAAAASGVIPGPATTGWFPFGKTLATGNATVAKIQLLNPNPYKTI